MLGKHSPKFGFDKTVKLPALDPDEYSSDQPYKMYVGENIYWEWSPLSLLLFLLLFHHSAFSAADGQYITPWITVSDGFGTYLQFVEFTFVYSGNDIIEMKWKTDCMPSFFQYLCILFIIYFSDNTGEHAGKIPTALYLHFNWEELKEKGILNEHENNIE